MEFRSIFNITKLVDGSPDFNLGLFTDIYYPISFEKDFEVGMVSSDKS